MNDEFRIRNNRSNSINFPRHSQGALVAAGVIGVVAIATNQVHLSIDSPIQFLHNPLQSGGIGTLLKLVFLGWFMGVFPDLDTASTPRKHYFRWVFVVLILLFFIGELETLAFVAILSFLPLLHKHRGWTHWKITPWVLAFLFAVLAEYLRAKNSWFFGFSVENVKQFLRDNWIYTFAIVTGHYTHLLLDAKVLKLFSTPKKR